ncbi:Panacea domain-containing protein [Actinokineospora iranica]|uniref:Uncharacterized phage-associated protein n=1 Tax=Actinokineospora iranica TaxID=1271860 RepID=A0A1G6RHT3_9PSEU|nr:type II toxin-antitoxin system antitoxin SocA domain-containing protein [Actinokineospora iranica]SDD03904.1 Uncharacterized phage-associated protein [Actinokineospora iranica]
MANVNDVAAYILRQAGPMSAMKLQKLVYYSQAWHLVWDERPLFDQPIEAWANGPVVPDLYRRHQGQYTLTNWPDGNSTRLSPSEQETVDGVVNAYGKYSAQQLSDLTHREQPWIAARAGLGPTERSRRLISTDAMQEYYSAVASSSEADLV